MVMKSVTFSNALGPYTNLNLICANAFNKNHLALIRWGSPTSNRLQMPGWHSSGPTSMTFLISFTGNVSKTFDANVVTVRKPGGVQAQAWGYLPRGMSRPRPGGCVSQHALRQTHPPPKQTATAAEVPNPTGMHSSCYGQLHLILQVRNG